MHVKQRNDYTRSKETEKTASRLGACKSTSLQTQWPYDGFAFCIIRHWLHAVSRQLVLCDDMLPLTLHASVHRQMTSKTASTTTARAARHRIASSLIAEFHASAQAVAARHADVVNLDFTGSWKLRLKQWHVLMAEFIYCAISYCNRIKASLYKYLRRKPHTTQINFPTFSLVFANNTSEIFFKFSPSFALSQVFRPNRWSIFITNCIYH